MTRQSLDALLLVLLGVFLASPSLAARSGSWPTCEIAKYEATQQMLACRLDKFAAGERTGRSADYTRCTRRFERQLARAERGFGSDCITADTSEALLASAEVLEADLEASLGDASTPRARKCVAKKAKIQASVLRCHQKQDRKLDRGRKPNYARCEDKARSRLERAESRFDGSCPVGDSHADVVRGTVLAQSYLYSASAGIDASANFCQSGPFGDTASIQSRYTPQYTKTKSANSLVAQIWSGALLGPRGLLGHLPASQLSYIDGQLKSRTDTSDDIQYVGSYNSCYPSSKIGPGCSGSEITMGVAKKSLLSPSIPFGASAQYCHRDKQSDQLDDFLATNTADFDFDRDSTPFVAAFMEEIFSMTAEDPLPAGLYPYSTLEEKLEDSPKAVRALRLFANAGPLGAAKILEAAPSVSIGSGVPTGCGLGVCDADGWTTCSKACPAIAGIKGYINGSVSRSWGMHLYTWRSEANYLDYMKHGEPQGTQILDMYWQSGVEPQQSCKSSTTAAVGHCGGPCDRNQACAAGLVCQNNLCQEAAQKVCSSQPGYTIKRGSNENPFEFETFQYYAASGVRFVTLDQVGQQASEAGANFATTLP